MKRVLFFLSFFPPALTCAAQDTTSAVRFIQSGTIEYERRENIRNEFTMEGDWADQVRQNMPEYRVTYFNLSFDGARSLFSPGRENPDNATMRMWFMNIPGASNIVYCDRSTGRFVSQKSAFGSLILEADTLRHLRWKINTDTRVIAGFECHRATTVIMDSVFVVAFYTDEIMPSAGPESFGGLPGMILGLVVPKLHSSWYATKLTLDVQQPLEPPKKGDKMTESGMLQTLKDTFKDWGSNMSTYLMRLMI